MKMCETCKGIGSVPVSPEDPGNTRRCAECAGTGLRQKVDQAARETPAVKSKTKAEE